MMVVQVAQTHRHVVSDRIRHRNRHAETQDAMDKSKRVKIAIAKEESTRDDPKTRVATTSTGFGRCAVENSTAAAITAADSLGKIRSSRDRK